MLGVFKGRDRTVVAPTCYLSGICFLSQLPTQPSWVYLLMGLFVESGSLFVRLRSPGV